MATERELIARHFTWLPLPTDVLLGVGDDAAVISVKGPLAMTCDTLVAGVHFTLDTDPFLLGRKALAVNLSDLAAMGATPQHFVLALTLAAIDDAWLGRFAQGMRALAQEHDVALVGGDLTHGAETSITITALGNCPALPLRQNGVKVDDDIWLSGAIGGADVSLREGKAPMSGDRLHDPTPRTALGKQLGALAHAAIDLSDGLCAASLLLARASSVRLELNAANLPLDPRLGSVMTHERVRTAVCGGEDYELLFTASSTKRDEIEQLATAETPLSRIGLVTAGKGCSIALGGVHEDMDAWATDTYQHFSNARPSNDNAHALAQAVGSYLGKVGLKLAVAESCTGGLLAAQLTNIPGASAWFKQGYVPYTAAMKTTCLGVKVNVIKQYGIVSEQVAVAMAKGALDAAGVDIAVGITGWAGPDGGDNGQPIGTVCIAYVHNNSNAFTRTFQFAGSRKLIRARAVTAALTLILACQEQTDN